ncbi:Nonribosomal peptide synthetase 13 [Podospora australis]|uniref:Nonribosomal peptide synthetase 13 n=1 Tax=Podospora australis TaxID=1536484 RepID=A0AAN6WP50_9PEZI|nr:Nonribosomal peptide synthetase 13 [Podospora australis]
MAQTPNAILSRADLDEPSLTALAEACHLPSVDQIEDVYTAVHQQHKQLDDPRCQRFQIVLYLGPIIDLDRWASTFRAIVASNPILRTHLVYFDSGPNRSLLQVLSNEPHITERFENGTLTLEEYLAADQARTLTYGDALLRSAIVGRNFVLSIHHAIMDYWSVTTLLQEDLILGYIAHPGPPLQRPPFKEFVKFLVGIDEAAATKFWAARFPAKQIPAIFPLVPKRVRPSPELKISKEFRFHGRVGSNNDDGIERVSPAHLPAYVEAAWALTAAIYNDITSSGGASDSVAYGLMLSGRSSSSAANTRVDTTFLGPAHAQVAVQVSLSSQQRASLTVEQFVRDRAVALRQLQSHPALQYSMDRVAKVSEAAGVATGFQTLLNVIPAVPSAHQAKKGDEDHIRMDRIVWKVRASVALMLRCQILEDGLLVDARFDPSILDEGQLWRVLGQFEHVLHAMMAPDAGRKKLDKLSLLSEGDRAEIHSWNDTLKMMPSKNESMLLQEIFISKSTVQPDATALCADDTTVVSYRELDQLSSRLARELHNRGVKQGTNVPLAMNNSLSAVVSILAILKLGAICAPLDPHSGLFELKEALKCLSPQPLVMLASSKLQASLSGVAENLDILNVSVDFLNGLLEVHDIEYPPVDPSAPAIAYITSSAVVSTLKKPALEVITLEHHALSSTLHSIAARLFLHSSDQENPRILHSSPYHVGTSIQEMFLAFLHGGCICIPPSPSPSSLPQLSLSKPISLPPSPPPSPPASPSLSPQEAKTKVASYLASFISSTNVTTAILHPRTLSSLSPSDVPSLHTIVVPVSTDSSQIPSMWLRAVANKEVKILTSSLSPRAFLLCTMSDPLPVPTSNVPSASINAGASLAGYATWIVQSGGSTTRALAPIGRVGELMVQGTGVAISGRNSNTDGKCEWFPTGDLAKYDSDGNIILIGAPKNRVRLSRAGRSFAVQLEEVERRISSLLEAFDGHDDYRISSAEVVALTKIAGGRTQIIAVVSCPERQNEMFQKDIQKQATAELDSDLLPAVWHWVAQPLPRTSGDRIDRVAVKEWVKGLKG